MSTLELRSARDWDKVEQIVDATYRAFSNRKPDDPFFRERMIDAPLLPLDNILVGRVAGEIATGLCIHDRHLYFGGRKVWAGLIGPVFTVPGYRHHGYAGKLLEYCCEHMLDKGYALSHLRAGSGRQSFYEGLGWVSIPSPAAAVDDPAPVGPSNGEWVTFDPDHHIEFLSETYRSQYCTVDGAMARPLVYWTDSVFEVESGGINGWKIALWKDGGDPVGYLIWAVDEGTITCHELACTDGYLEAFRRDCWNRLAQAGETIVWKPPLGDLRKHLNTQIQMKEHRNFMIRVEDKELLSAVSGDPVRGSVDVVDHVSDGDWYWSQV